MINNCKCFAALLPDKSIICDSRSYRVATLHFLFNQVASD